MVPVVREANLNGLFRASCSSCSVELKQTTTLRHLTAVSNGCIPPPESL